jgi:DNA-directed RNA polymerase subunit A'
MTEIIRKQVKSISFSLINPEEIKKIAVAKIITPELYDMDGYPVDGGLMDLRMGAIDPGVRCRTCGGRLKECLGHFGYIEMARPVIHIKYMSSIQAAMNSVCNSCSKALISEEDAKRMTTLERQKKAKDAKKCPHCNAVQEKVKIEKPTSFIFGKKRIFPSEIRSRLEKVNDDELKLIGINADTARPEWGVLTLLLVPPVTVRPSITLESSERSEDDLTHKLGDIIRANQRLWENLNAGAPEVIVEDLWDLLQYHVTTFFDNSVAGVPPARHRSGQPLKTITERIKGKEGRIRHNLAGKRVNYSSRTVISPDPFMEVDEIGVPLEIAKVITVAERVNSTNLEKMKKLVLSEEYPAANYIIRPDGKRKRITPDLQQELSEEITIGYIVERHLTNKDILLFNRHPSLHKMSLMSHYAKILPGRTFRLHPAVAFPYNADFDGDEMNIHSPQTEEARAEAEVLLEIKKQLISPKNNTNMIGNIADAVTGNYLLSSSEISKQEAVQLLYESGVENKLKLNQKLSGLDVFSAIFPKIDFSERTKLCRGSECPHYNKKAEGANCFANCKKEKCPFNAYLSIKEGKLESGIIDSRTFGVEEGAIIKEFDKEFGRDATVKLLKNIFSIGSLYLSRRGFTISLEDIKVPAHVNEATKKIITTAEEKVEGIIELYKNNSLELLPGKTREETMEIKVLHSLNEVRSKIGELVKKDLPKTNPVYTMILSGAGGNVIHTTQMACSVGQQAFWGKRINMGFVNRTLSFFKKYDLSPKSRGFIYSSFLQGVKPYEFFFGAMTGRDGLMDTALRTPKSGYLYRRLVNALQDLKVEYDHTIRDASGNIIQFEYGGDNSDVSRLHLKNKQIDPAEAIGVIAAQSFGEPSVQMTLNVFHFAGVSEMQVTLGLPRLIEIFDARKKPSTPLMEIYLQKEYNNEESAKDIAARIKQVKLNEIVNKITINFTEKRINIELDKESMKKLHVTPSSITSQIEEKGYKVKISDNNTLIIKSKEDFKGLYKSKEKIKEIIVSGVVGVEQVLPVKREDNYIILTSGTNLEDVMKFKGVDSNKTTSNDIHEVEKVLGIEAARESIIKEIMKVLDQQGLDIDIRHVKIVADAMTSSGTIKGITRIGIISEKTSVLARASFETPVKHFVNATLKGQRDELASVIENVILNQPVPVGTGLPGLLVNITGKLNKTKKEGK